MMAGNLTRMLVTVAALGQVACAWAELPAVERSGPTVAQLVAQLDHAEFSLRERAEAALVARGAAVFDELRNFHDDDSPEIRFRVRRIVTRAESALFAGRWQLIRWEKAGKAKEGTENIIEIQGHAWRAQPHDFAQSSGEPSGDRLAYRWPHVARHLSVSR